MAKYTKKPWKPEYQRILLYAEQGMPVKEIAEKVQMHPRTVYDVMNKDEFVARKQDFEDKIVDKARGVFEKHALKAAERIATIADKGTAKDRIRFDASKEVLYQIGMKPVEVIETRKREYTPEEMASMEKTAAELENITKRLARRDSRFIIKSDQPNEITVNDAGTESTSTH